MASKGTRDFALVLSGGAAKGIYHIGALKAIREYGLNITAMAGRTVSLLESTLAGCRPKLTSGARSASWEE